MISYITGQLGSGKTQFAVMRGARALLSGRVWATNIELRDGWEHRLLLHAPYYVLAGRRARKEYRIEVRERYYFSYDFGTLVNLRLHGRGEGRGLRTFDEAHNELNSRDWQENRQKYNLRKMTLSRKRGWNDDIIAQHASNTDAALRRISTVEIEMLNWRQLLRMPLLHTPLLPFNLFLAVSYRLKIQGDTVVRVKKPLHRELHRLGWWSQLYDTNQDYDVFDEASSSDIWLPLRAGKRGPSGAAAGSGGAVILRPRQERSA